MADHTYQELNQNEVRTVQLTIEDTDGVEFAPSAAYATIKDKSGNTVVPQQTASLQDNNVYVTVNTMTTSAEGSYNLIWELRKDGFVYYHCTELEIIPLCLGD